MVQPVDKVTILVVEDDAATGTFLVDLLHFHRYSTLVATSGRDALIQFAAHSVNVVVLEQRLPDMDGLDVCRHIRRSMPGNVPIILLTADYSTGLEAAARDAGVSDYLKKPFDPLKLVERIAILTGQ